MRERSHSSDRLVGEAAAISQAKRRWVWGALACVTCAVVLTAMTGRADNHAAAPYGAVATNVRQYGARGDGKTDDTAAFQQALDAQAARGGTVTVAPGRYLIATHLTIPAGVALVGSWRAPAKYDPDRGSTLLAVEGAGSESGAPFISMNANSTLEGIAIDYPNQSSSRITPYPWCIASAGGDDISIRDCLLVNPYQGVDFGTHPAGRHLIQGLYGQPLRRGIFVDQCYDIGRIENVHFWTFWAWDNNPYVQKWMAENSEAFIFGRTDWEYVTNTFCFGDRIGYRFIHTSTGEANGNFSGIGADASNIAVDIEASQTPGLLITNGEFVAFQGPNPTEIVVGSDHRGVAQFQNCAFWGPSDQIARIAGSGYVSFNNCNFREWDHANRGIPALTVSGGDLTVTGCNFSKPAPQAVLDGAAKSAVFTGNHMAGPLSIKNTANADLQAGLNTAAH